jgi:IS4 transposase
MQLDSPQNEINWQQTILNRETIDSLAAQAGFGERNRKLTPFKFLLAVVFGFGVEKERTLAGLQRFFCATTGSSVVSSAFQTRFTSQAVVFFKLVYEDLLGRLPNSGSLPMGLQRFKDVLAVDGSVISLKDKLCRKFKACRTNVTKAAAKLHAVVSLSTAAITDLDIRSERYSERRFFKKLIPEFSGRLLLFDLGYFKHTFFERLVKMGAFFVSRLKDSSNPYLIEVTRGIRNKKAAVGTRLDDNEFEGPVFEALVSLGKSGEQVFRLVGIRFPGTIEYRFYLTNLLGLEFSAEDIAAIYTRRWQVELLFKELKGICRIDELPSSKPNTVLCLMYASLIALLVGRLMKVATEQQKATAKPIRRTVVSKLLGQHAMEFVKAILSGVAAFQAKVAEFVTIAAALAADPNVKRVPCRLGVVTY